MPPSPNPRHETVPTLSSADVKLVDRLASERFGIPVSWLMEAAGWQLARHCRARTYVVCGGGNNGGDGLAVARHLHRWGLLAGVACIEPDGLAGAAQEELIALRLIGVTPDARPPAGFRDADVVLDALLGIGLSGAPAGRLATWISAINGSGKRVVSVDLPSGLVGDTGDVPGECVKADVTVTLCLPKPALLTERGSKLAGDVWVVDIGLPDEVYVEAGVEPPGRRFATDDRMPLAAFTGAARSRRPAAPA